MTDPQNIFTPTHCFGFAAHLLFGSVHHSHQPCFYPTSSDKPTIYSLLSTKLWTGTVQRLAGKESGTASSYRARHISGESLKESEYLIQIHQEETNLTHNESLGSSVSAGCVSRQMFANTLAIISSTGYNTSELFVCQSSSVTESPQIDWCSFKSKRK